MKIYRALKAIIVRAADSLHQLLAAEYPTRSADKRLKELEFFWGEADRLFAEPDLVTLQIERQIAKAQR